MQPSTAQTRRGRPSERRVENDYLGCHVRLEVACAEKRDNPAASQPLDRAGLLQQLPEKSTNSRISRWLPFCASAFCAIVGTPRITATTTLPRLNETAFTGPRSKRLVWIPTSALMRTAKEPAIAGDTRPPRAVAFSSARLKRVGPEQPE
jgi:hypothetical protein